MSKATALDRVRRYLERSHATNIKNVPNIIATGSTRPMPHYLDNGEPTVFTSAGTNAYYNPGEWQGRNSIIRYRIPKDWHRQHVVENPHYLGKKVQKDPNWESSYRANEIDRSAFDVMNGGRTTTYNAAIPNEYIDEVCFGPNGEYCYDPEVLRRHVINEDPVQGDEMWEWDYWSDWYPDYPEVFEKYGRK